MRPVNPALYLNPHTGERVCHRCKEIKTVDDFHKSRNTVDGLHPWCKECRRTTPSEVLRGRAYALNRTRENPELAMWHGARTRARKKNLPFTITVQDIQIPIYCPVPIHDPPCLLIKQKGHPSQCSPSLDMYIPVLGYILGNIWVICLRCNRRKQDQSPRELIFLGKAMESAFQGGV